MSRKSKSKDHTKALNIPLTLTQGDLLQEALAVTFVKPNHWTSRSKYSQNGMAVREWIWDFGKPIRFLPKSVSAYHYHSGKSCTVLCKWWTIWSFEWKTENPWTVHMTWEKTSTSSSKPLNWEFTSGSTSCLMENGHCILRREEWPWIFTNGKNWKNIPLFEDRGPELRTMDNKVTGED